MNTEELYKLINESEWHPAPETKICNHLEYSEMFALWNDDVSYLIHGVRDCRYPDNVVLAVMQDYPTHRFYTDIFEVDIDWTNIKVMSCSDMRKDKKIHYEFLKRKE